MIYELSFKGSGALMTFYSQEDLNITQHESIYIFVRFFKLLSPTHSSCRALPPFLC